MQKTRDCGDLNDRFIHLNWSQVGRTVWEGIGGMALSEGPCHGEGFEVLKANTISSYFSLTCGCVSKFEIQGTFLVPCLTACFCATCHDENELYSLKMWTLIKSFF